MDKKIKEVQEIMRTEYSYICFDFSHGFIKDFIESHNLAEDSNSRISDLLSDYILSQGLAEDVVE